MAEERGSKPGRRAACLLVLLLATIFIGILMTSAADGFVPQQRNPFLLGAYFKCRQLKDLAEQNIARLEAEIRRNRDVADRSKKLMALASQRSDENARRAEQTAAQALRLAEESLARNEKTLSEWRSRKALTEKALGELMAMMKEGKAGRGAALPLGLISSPGSLTQIVRADGSSMNLDADSPGFLAPGDTIRTADSPVEFQALGGRATAQLDRNSELSVLSDTSYGQVFELGRGRMHGVVDKVDDFLARLKQGFEDYREDLGTVKDLFTDDELMADFRKQMKVLYLRRFGDTRIRTKDGVPIIEAAHLAASVRGTEFVMMRFGETDGEVWVLDGEVELTFPERNQTVIIKSGQKCSFAENGPSDPIPFDTVERWWER